MPTKTRKTVVAPPAPVSAPADPAPRRAARKGVVQTPAPAAPAEVSQAAPKKSVARKAAAKKTTAKTPTVMAPAGDAAPAAGAASAAAAVPASTPVLKPLAALGVDEGVFVLVAAAAALEPVQSFARYAEEPLPHLLPSGEGAWQRSQRVNGAVVYVAFVPWPKPPAGAIKLGCITASGRKPVFGVESVRLGVAPAAAVAALLERYGKLLLPALEAVLPAVHPLRRALAPKPAVAAAPAAQQPTPAVVQGHFDGVVDEQAHGWVFCPAQPGQRLTVEVLSGEEVVARGVADHYRDDLQANGIGDGEHHFRLVLSCELFDGRPHELAVRVVETGTLLPERAVATLPQRQLGGFDLMPRAQALAAAREWAAKLQVRDPKALQTLLQALRTASLQQETGQLAAARKGYERLLHALGTNALCHCRIAETWLLEQELDKARAAYEACIRADAGLAWGHLGLGTVLQLQGRPLEAESAYRSALAALPGLAAAQARLDGICSEAAVARARQQLDQGDRQGAIAQLSAVLIQRPDHALAMQQLDDLLREPASGSRTRQPEPVEGANRARRLLDAVLDEVERRLSAPERA